ncbi:putative bifunctional diguanylate cyclase/phosphodiesterase [Pseudemcibacter aquimaris]|uniref:putative bifunctional diguanylate cyclase/phosphodiesterase n=1 Tax=Pseudemcibacter aquimaris TaxID=2857064 RepID=UPI002012377C|nr:GGDEF domain-containing phosphodiesterase [Pseudemcibacter aquimaris]MCC3859808.1 GGDEF domain-containing phosphodiesterase [Pseudemcibacter aquimaris]WDU60202.1 GGDEF domain-containing phosphodiesterase [Pseudemcibacter aquimaris]
MKDPIQYDSVSGLPDRGHLWSLLDDSLKMVRRSKGSSGVLLIQMNNVNGIRELVGEDGVNEFMRMMGSRIKNCLWDLDGAAHFDDNQFVVVANSISKIEDIHVVMKKVHEYLAIDFEINGHIIKPSSTIGIVLLPNDAMEIDQVMEVAAQALNSATPRGENNYAYYNQEIGARIEEQEAVKSSIMATLAEESFVLMLQPKIDTTTNAICGVEALVRMRDSDNQLVSPDEFIPVAENSNLILKIGDWVLKKVRTLLTEWKEKGIDIPVSINISDVEFKNSAALISALHSLKEDEDFDTNKVILEISENSITNNPVISAAILSEFQNCGYQVSIDGFGAGFSSLSVLKDLKVNEIKIDRHFVNNVPADEKSTAILQSIIMLGKSMDFRVVCMGVESQEQFETLKEHNCDELQGYLISKPLEITEFEEWLNNYSA